MSYLEKLAEDQIKSIIKRTGGWVVKIHADEIQGRDTLDLIGSYAGKPFFVDVKAPGESATPIQEYLIKRAQRSGYISGAVTSIEEFIGLFK